MDPQMRAMMERQKAARLEQLRVEMAWDLEKHRIAHVKLQDRFINTMEYGRFVVKAFLTGQQVSTLRCPKLSREFNEILTRPAVMSAVQKLRSRASQALVRKKSKGLDAIEPLQSVSDVEGDADSVMERASPTFQETSPKFKRKPSLLTGTLKQQEIDEALSKNEERKRRKEERKRLWDQLLASKPDEKYVNPVDADAIKYAQKNMGDYKLKASSDYEIPVAERINTAKKREQLLVLRRNIFESKVKFNIHLNNLRDRKKTFIAKVFLLFFHV
jgi:hypothetical protein